MQEWVAPIGVAVVVGILSGAGGAIISSLILGARHDERIKAMKEAAEVSNRALKELIENNDKRLWDQIGRESHQGMRRIVHACEHLPKRYMELDKRLDRIEGKPKS